MKRTTEQELFDLIDRGVKAGVARALLEHRKAGSSVFIWHQGRVVCIEAARIKTGNGLRKGPMKQRRPDFR
jgi:hypothetical protein